MYICSRDYFNPRAPCGARLGVFTIFIDINKFQPTRPLRGATLRDSLLDKYDVISTHAPLAGRDNSQMILALHLEISTHAPLAGRDVCVDSFNDGEAISTHAPLAGRDVRSKARETKTKNFNPRAPCGARQQKCTNHYAHFCDNRQISDAFAQNAACQGILLLFDAGKPCGFWVRTAQVISARLCFAL